MIFHPLNIQNFKPLAMNNPFYYQPNEVCLKVQKEIVYYIESKTEWHEEISSGKMFGFLIAENTNGATGYLAAFSGQIQGSENHDFFVPPVFDYLDPDGYFKTKEKEISDINNQIQDLEKTAQTNSQQSEALKNAQAILKEIAEYKQFMKISKINRESRRKNPDLSDEDRQNLIAESQFQNAELRRLKQRYDAENLKFLDESSKISDTIKSLKELRKQKSVELQNYLFSNFVMLNAKGEKRDLLHIFKEYNNIIPPSGSGECCAPKLLQYAYLQDYKPLFIAEFWWGRSPIGEIRKHLNFYPACQGKCKPILDFMLRGLTVYVNPLEENQNQDFETIFEDNFLVVINKPAGMLSVPGKNKRISVAEIAKTRFGSEAIVVHRLDMATSGIMVIAKNLEIYKKLQQQFENHDVKKVYYAVLDGEVKRSEGTISLPLMPDIADRPRQKVDFKHGKPAETFFKVDKVEKGKTYIYLYPQTGRTHQLRVHCAYNQGLNHPIIGDELYGEKAKRMYLHAMKITFTHPITNETLTFETDPNFDI
ncbi:MAG: RluA family pseudouridine synthase [Bacteroidales bacterium]|nr:RluA family pseudouridine synthase [Bacteroidales bacterium]